MPNLEEKAFFAERAEYDLRKTAIPYSRKDGIVTISDEALEKMRVAPSVGSISVKGRKLLPIMTDEEIKAANEMGLAFLDRPASDNFMAAKRRLFGRPEKK